MADSNVKEQALIASPGFAREVFVFCVSHPLFASRSP
jgi:hypothetical protein